MRRSLAYRRKRPLKTQQWLQNHGFRPLVSAASVARERGEIGMTDARLPMQRYQNRVSLPILQTSNSGSVGTCSAVASAFVCEASIMIETSSACWASVMPFARAIAVCECTQYSHPLAVETAM